MFTPLAVACTLIIVTLFLSVISRSIMSESRLGAYTTGQTLRTVKKLESEASYYGKMARQDTNPHVSLINNAEAVARQHAAMLLLMESGEPVPDGIRELGTLLYGDREALWAAYGI